MYDVTSSFSCKKGSNSSVFGASIPDKEDEEDGEDETEGMDDCCCCLECSKLEKNASISAAETAVDFTSGRGLKGPTIELTTKSDRTHTQTHTLSFSLYTLLYSTPYYTLHVYLAEAVLRVGRTLEDKLDKEEEEDIEEVVQGADEAAKEEDEDEEEEDEEEEDNFMSSNPSKSDASITEVAEEKDTGNDTEVSRGGLPSGSVVVGARR